MTLATGRLILLRIRVLLLLWILLLALLALLRLLAKNRDELPLIVFLTSVINLDGFLTAVGGNSNDSAASYGRAIRRRTAAVDVRQLRQSIVASCLLRALLALLGWLVLRTAGRSPKIHTAAPSDAVLLLSRSLKASLLLLLLLLLLLPVLLLTKDLRISKQRLIIDVLCEYL